MAPLFSYGVGAFSLPIPHGMHLVASAQFCFFGWCVIPARHFPQKNLGRNLKIGLPLSLPLNHALLPLTHDLTMSCIGWVQAGELWALHMPSFHVCPKSACCSLVRCGLKACLHSLPFVLWPFMWAAFWFSAPLRVDIYLLLGFTLLSAHFLIALISCHITLSFLP